jgi:hypothetical protein
MNKLHFTTFIITLIIPSFISPRVITMQQPQPQQQPPKITTESPATAPQSSIQKTYAMLLQEIKSMPTQHVITNNAFTPQFLSIIQNSNLSPIEQEALLQAGMTRHAQWNGNDNQDMMLLNSLTKSAASVINQQQLKPLPTTPSTFIKTTADTSSFIKTSEDIAPKPLPIPPQKQSSFAEASEDRPPTIQPLSSIQQGIQNLQAFRKTTAATNDLSFLANGIVNHTWLTQALNILLNGAQLTTNNFVPLQAELVNNVIELTKEMLNKNNIPSAQWQPIITDITNQVLIFMYYQPIQGQVQKPAITLPTWVATHNHGLKLKDFNIDLLLYMDEHPKATEESITNHFIAMIPQNIPGYAELTQSIKHAVHTLYMQPSTHNAPAETAIYHKPTPLAPQETSQEPLTDLQDLIKQTEAETKILEKQVKKANKFFGELEI